MIKEEFYYDSRDGKSRLHATRYMPDDPDDICGVLQVVHGMSEYFQRYEELARFMTARGFVVTGEDHIGHGKSIGKTGKCGYFCEQDPATVLVRDVHRLKKKTEALYPNLPYILLGHSMGSFIVRNYISRYGTGVDAAILLGTGMQSKALLNVSKFFAFIQKAFCGSEHVSRLMDKLAFGQYNARIENPATPSDWLTRDTEAVAKFVADPMCGFIFTVNGFSTLFELLSRLNDEQYLEKIPKNLPVLMLSGTADPVGDYGKGVQKSYDSLVGVGLTDIEMKMYQDCRHELLNETNRLDIMEDIYSWLGKRFLDPDMDSKQKQSTI